MPTITYSAEQVTVHFLYWDPSTDPTYCGTCPSWLDQYQKFLAKNQTVARIQEDYSQVTFVRINFYSSAAAGIEQELNIRVPNSLVINMNVTIEGEFNETYIRMAIDAFLNDTSLPTQPPESLLALVVLAFGFGLAETFSPCLIILLSFVLSYTLGKSNRFRDGILRVMSFSTGFIIAALLLGVSIALASLSLGIFKIILMWGVSLFAIVFGLSLLGITKNVFETKPTVKKLAEKYALSFGGLVLLGFVFYFLDPCIAPIFVMMLPILSTDALFIVLLVFTLGMIVPFVAIGIVAGSISKLVRVTYKNRAIIRAISGLILVGYAIYVIIFYLL
jgi:cytochrome c biogenesis protein CcdA